MQIRVNNNKILTNIKSFGKFKANVIQYRSVKCLVVYTIWLMFEQ